jgi:AraC-like DNA-binding protein
MQAVNGKLISAVCKTQQLNGDCSQKHLSIDAYLALVQRVTERLTRSLAEPPTLTSLAAELNMSPRTLTRRVQAATGGTLLTLLQS